MKISFWSGLFLLCSFSVNAQDSLQVSQAYVDSLESVNNVLQDEVNRLEGEMVDLKKTNENYSGYIETLEEGKTKAEERAKQSEDLVGDLQKQIKQLEKDKAASDRKLQKSEGSKAEIARLESENDKLQEQANRAVQLESELKKTENKVRTLENDVQRLERDQKNWEKERNDLRAENQRLATELNSLKDGMGRFQRYLTTEMRTLENGVNALYQRSTLATDESEISQLENTVQNLAPLVADADKPKLIRLTERLRVYRKAWDAMELGAEAVSTDYSAQKVNQAVSALRTADFTDLPAGIQSQKTKLETAVAEYCTVYNEVRGYFDQFKDIQTDSFIERMVGQMIDPNSSDYINPAYTFIHTQLQRRHQAPGEKTQPFTAATNCN